MLGEDESVAPSVSLTTRSEKSSKKDNSSVVSSFKMSSPSVLDKRQQNVKEAEKRLEQFEDFEDSKIRRFEDSRTSFMEKTWMSYLSTKHGLMKTSVTQRFYTPTTPSSGKIEQEEMVAVSWLESKQVRSARSRNSLQTWMA